MRTKTSRSEKFDLRLSRKAKEILRTAAGVAHRSVSEFVLESALARAEETLADRRDFTLDAKRWMAFLAALDEPPKTLPRLKKLLNEPGIFDRI